MQLLFCIYWPGPLSGSYRVLIGFLSDFGNVKIPSCFLWFLVKIKALIGFLSCFYRVLNIGSTEKSKISYQKVKVATLTAFGQCVATWTTYWSKILWRRCLDLISSATANGWWALQMHLSKHLNCGIIVRNASNEPWGWRASQINLESNFGWWALQMHLSKHLNISKLWNNCQECKQCSSGWRASQINLESHFGWWAL